jgi:4-amino-4-deoxy-L-arabinose transferase-like glycosyltransferase
MVMSMVTFFSVWHRTLFVIFVLAAVIRATFIFSLQDGFYFPDSVFYSDAAVNLITNGELGETYNRGPVYPAFLAAIYGLFGERILYIRIVESLLGALLAAIVAILGKRIGGETVGALAGLLWSVYPIGVFIAGLVYPTALAATLLACGAWCLLPPPDQEFSLKRVLFGGLLLGLGTLTVPMVLATTMVMGVWLFYWGRRQRLALVSLLLLGSALTIVPWTIRNYVVHDRLVAIEPRVLKHLPRFSRSDNALPGDKIEAIMKRPHLFALRFGKEFLRFWQLYPDRIKMSKTGVRDNVHARDPRVVRDTIFKQSELITLVSILSTGPVFVFAIIGIAVMWSHKHLRPHLSMLWAMLLSFAAGYSVFVSQTRYRIPVEPYIIILSAYGLAQTWQLLRPKVWREAAGATRVGRSKTASPLSVEIPGSPSGEKL